jgi:hypothetical protein
MDKVPSASNSDCAFIFTVTRASDLSVMVSDIHVQTGQFCGERQCNCVLGSGFARERVRTKSYRQRAIDCSPVVL